MPSKMRSKSLASFSVRVIFTVPAANSHLAPAPSRRVSSRASNLRSGIGTILGDEHHLVSEHVSQLVPPVGADTDDRALGAIDSTRAVASPRVGGVRPAALRFTPRVHRPPSWG